MSDRVLYLVDGNSLLYRAYYAIRNLSTSSGFPTNAIYGFISTLRKILSEAEPGYLGVVFDGPGPKTRHEMFKEYKAQRKPMPEDLIPQIPKLKDILRALRIPVFEHPRYEADDVLASLAVRAAAARFKTVIVTSDKDLFQLVDDRTEIFNPGKDILLDEAKVKEFFGAAPDQVVDVLALWGDPSDNIPGVPGIGEKTAKKLIEEFGSLDKILENLEKIKNPRTRAAIEQNRDVLELSRALARVERDVDVDFDPAAFKRGEPDAEELTRLFRELEFTALLQEMVKTAGPAGRKYSAVFRIEEIRALAERIRRLGFVSVDTETDSEDPTRARLVGISLALEPGEAFYIPLRHDYLGAPEQVAVEDALGALRGVLEDPAIRKIGQNIKYDDIVFRREGVRLGGIDLDTMVLSYLLEPNWGKHNLDRMALTYLGEAAIPFQDVAGKGRNQVTLNKAAVESVTPYSCQDADFALALSRIFWPRIEAEKMDALYRDLEQPLIGILAEMEISGVKIDVPALKALSGSMERDLKRLEKEIHELAGTAFNINSPPQLSNILFHKLQIQPSRKTKATRNFSTAMDVLEDIAEAHPVVRKVLEYRQAAKLKSTYADALPELVNPETGRVHTSYNQTVASTGRLSSSNPNLQNIPARGEMGARFRRAFIPEPGHLFLAADYSQIELRVLAHMSKDPAMNETFRRGGDIHQETAERVFGGAAGPVKGEERRRAKIINFSIIYGTSAFSLAKQLQTTAAEAQRFIDLYYEKYPKVREFLDALVKEAEARGFSTTLFGRKRQVPELRSPDRVLQQAGRRIALNTPIQGTAADIMKKAMVDIRRAMEKAGLRARLILQVHDELVFEAPEGERERLEKIVRRGLEEVCPFEVPLSATLGWGPNWADAK